MRCSLKNAMVDVAPEHMVAQLDFKEAERRRNGGLPGDELSAGQADKDIKTTGQHKNVARELGDSFADILVSGVSRGWRNQYDFLNPRVFMRDDADSTCAC